MLTLIVGAEVPWVGSHDAIPTDKGSMTFSRISARDGFTVYEAVGLDVAQDVPAFVVLVDVRNDTVAAVVEFSAEDTWDTLWDKVAAAKRAHWSTQRGR